MHLRRESPGVTLIEVLVALVLLCVGLLALGSLQLASLRSVRAAGVHTRARALAREVLERTRADSAGTSDASAWTARAARVLPAGRMRIDPGAHLHVTVSWRARNGSRARIEMEGPP